MFMLKTRAGLPPWPPQYKQKTQCRPEKGGHLPHMAQAFPQGHTQGLQLSFPKRESLSPAVSGPDAACCLQFGDTYHSSAALSFLCCVCKAGSLAEHTHCSIPPTEPQVPFQHASVSLCVSHPPGQ